MTIAEDMWLRGQAAQRNILQVASYSTAFAGTAALQGFHLGLTAPTAFWAAMARAAATPPAQKARAPKTNAKPAEIVPLMPETAAVEVADAPPPAPAPASSTEPEVAAAIPAADQPEMGGPSPHLLDEPRAGKPDDLTVLAGVGAKLASALNEFGIYHFDQIAALDEEGIAWLDAQQKGFRMICARYDLVGQAKALS